MAINRWLGIATPRVAKSVYQPRNIKPGSLWLLRVGSATYSYEFASTVETDGTHDDNERAKIVVDGLVAAYSGNSLAFGGGSTVAIGSLTAEVYAGRWALVVTGRENGAPLDVEVTATDVGIAAVLVTQMQAGRQAKNEIQRIKFPASPTAGNWKVRYKDKEASVAYNVSASALQTAIEGLSGIGAGNVVVTGSYTAGYVIEFQGSLAGQNVEMLGAYSEDFQGVASYNVAVATDGGLRRQTYVMGALSGRSDWVYRFTYGGESSYLFTAALGDAALQSTLESISLIGAGNVSVVKQANGTYEIVLIGKFVGSATQTLSVQSETQGASTVTLTTTAIEEFAEKKTLTMTLVNMPHSGTFTLSYNNLTTGNISLTATASAVTTALSTAGITEWTCTSFVSASTAAAVLTLQATANSPKDIGVVLANTAGLVGCHAIDVRVTQYSQTARNEIQQVAITGDPTGGTFTLTFNSQTTSAQAYNVSASSLQTALRALSSIGSGNCNVSGAASGPYLVEFISGKGAASQALITGNGTSLTLAASASVTTTVLQTPTGPNWWTNDKNWELTHAPDSDEVATFDFGAVPCLYGIKDVARIAGVDCYRSYTGQVGLPARREDGSPETLNQYLSFSSNEVAAVPVRVGLGDDGAGPSLVKLDTQLQLSDVTVLYSGQALAGALYSVDVSGNLGNVHVVDGLVAIGIQTGRTTSVDALRISPTTGQAETAVLEWGESATVDFVEMTGGTLRAGSVPTTLRVLSGDCIVRGNDGYLKTLFLQNARLRYMAGGKLGTQGTISAIGLHTDNRAKITSNAHGLVTGDRIFLRGGALGIPGIAQGYYVIERIDANNFALIGTAPDIAGEEVDTYAEYYGYATAYATAHWGLVERLIVGAGGILDFSAINLARTLVAPIVLQSLDAVVIDPLKTVSTLRLKNAPGYLEEAFGSGMTLVRE